jgi:hypothetical protein
VTAAKRPIKRTKLGSSSVAGARARVEVKKPICPMHSVTMFYDPEDLYWHCTFKDCRIIQRQKGDHVLASMGNYTGPLSIVHDKRTGQVFLRLAPSSFTGSAPLVLLYKGDPDDNVEGVSQAALNAQRREAAFSFNDVVTVDHSGRVRR